MATAAAAPQSQMAEHARAARPARLLAIIADTVLFELIALFVNGVFGVTVVTSGSPAVVGAGTATFSTATAVDWPWLAILSVLYFMAPEAVFGATPGKALAGLRVVRTDGRALGLGDVAVRNLLRPIDYLPFLYLVGGAFVMATAQSRRLGDLAAGTTVVSKVHAAAPGATRRPHRGAFVWLGLMVAAGLVYSAAFAYFGRPPLILQSEFNTRSGIMENALAYQLGAPSWGFGQVTYPLTVTVRIGGPAGQLRVCHGSIELDWEWLGGWSPRSGGYNCG